jgi:hypothetical protein
MKECDNSKRHISSTTQCAFQIWATILLTYLLTPWCRVLLEGLTGPQLVKKFPTFYGTRKFITSFTRVRHLSLFRARSVQSMPPHLSPWRSFLILFSHLPLGLQSGLFPSGFPTRTLYRSFLPNTCYMPRPSHSSRFDHPYNIGWWLQIIKLIIKYFSPVLCYLVHLRPKYSPQHHILEQPQPTFVQQCWQPSFTPLKTTGQIIVLYTLIFIFLDSKPEDKR